MPEEKTTDTEILNEEVLDGKVDMGDAETPAESSTEKTAGEAKTGEVEKTQVEEKVSETKPDDEVKEGQPIPYPRFKQVNDKLKGVEAELGEARGFFKNPDVFRAMLIARGVTDKKVQDEKLKEAGFEVKAPPTPDDDVFKQITEGVDLNTKEGWFKSFKKAFDLWGKELVSPIQKKLSDRETDERSARSETEAKKLAKESFNLEYGEARKDEGNPNTAIGKMWAYLNKYPDHAGFGHSVVLRLALSEEGYSLGKQEGIKGEKARNESLKNSAMETGEETVREGEPSDDWTVDQLMKYARAHSK